MKYPASIPVAFGSVVQRCKELVLADLIEANSKIKTLNYIYSPEKEMRETLEQMSKGIATSKKMFPLIWLWEKPIVENRSNQRGFYASVSLHVFIMFYTKQTYKSFERETEVFDPILRPIYWKLLEALDQSVAFNSPDEFHGINHDKIDHKFLGMNNQAESWVSTFVDAIEIPNLQLQVDYENCRTVIPFIDN